MTPAEFMRLQVFNDAQGSRMLAAILELGDEVGRCLQDFMRSNTVTAAQPTGIGRLSDVVLLASGQPRCTRMLGLQTLTSIRRPLIRTPLIESPAHLRREHDWKSTLALIGPCK